MNEEIPYTEPKIINSVNGRSEALKNLLIFCLNVGEIILNKIIALITLPFNLIQNLFLKKFKQIPSPPPYSGPWINSLYNFIMHVRFRTKSDNRFIKLENKMRERLLEESKRYGFGPTLEVTRVHCRDIDGKNWADIYEGYPVIVEGLLENSNALKNWTLDYFKENYGDTKVQVRNKGVMKDCFSKAKINAYDGYFSMISVSELVDDIRNGGAKYMSTSSSIFEKHEELLDHMDFERLEKFFGRIFVRVEMFMGGQQNATAFHCAALGNLFCQILGEKRWVLVSARHAKWMYPRITFNNKVGLFFTSPVVSDDEEEINQKYPLFKYVPKFVAHLKPGDLLYVPPWWWHEIKNFGETIGIPIRVMTHDDTNYPSNLSMVFTSPAVGVSVMPAFKRVIFGMGKKGLILSDNLTKSKL